MTERMLVDDMAPDYSFVDIESADDAYPYWEDDVDMELVYLDLWDRIARGLPIRGSAVEEET
ncbi:unnamed protein product [marine sediment metagenome]|uniref:Uncharacterized protein n=1 Tax=marine sediment metagenome TaxID=412755 RepID=X0RX45_9ZZZZ